MHTSGGKENCWVVFGNEWGGWYADMAFGNEKIKILLTDLVGSEHDKKLLDEK
jgi:hypothetical protein